MPLAEAQLQVLFAVAKAAAQFNEGLGTIRQYIFYMKT